MIKEQRSKVSRDMDDCKGQQAMYNKGLHGKAQHSEELGGTHGLNPYQHWVQALLIECNGDLVEGGT